MEISNDVFNSVKTYFNSLSTLGYRNYKEVDKLLVFIFLEEILTEDTSYFISEEDYTIINKALDCLYGTTCLLPYPTYRQSVKEAINSLPDKYRITDNSVLRMMDSNHLRTAD